jgi:hypothetical protein
MANSPQTGTQAKESKMHFKITVKMLRISQDPWARGTPQAVAKCAWPWLFVLAVAVCSFLLKMSKILG